MGAGGQIERIRLGHIGTVVDQTGILPGDDLFLFGDQIVAAAVLPRGPIPPDAAQWGSLCLGKGRLPVELKSDGQITAIVLHSRIADAQRIPRFFGHGERPFDIAVRLQPHGIFAEIFKPPGALLRKRPFPEGKRKLIHCHRRPAVTGVVSVITLSVRRDVRRLPGRTRLIGGGRYPPCQQTECRQHRKKP